MQIFFAIVLAVTVVWLGLREGDSRGVATGIGVLAAIAIALALWLSN